MIERSRLLTASRLLAHWGLGMTLGSIGGKQVLFLGIGVMLIGQISAHIFRWRKPNVIN